MIPNQGFQPVGAEFMICYMRSLRKGKESREIILPTQYNVKENIDVSNIQPIFIQVIHKPERLCIIKRGLHAEDYFPYCEEVSCDVWGILMSMKSLCGEPVSLWLPEKYKKPNTSTYVQGVEVETDYMGMIPEGFDTIHLPEAEYLMFQGQPFREEDYCEAIRTVQAAMDSYDPSVIGYR